MPEPKGNLVTPIGIDAAGNLYALLVDAGGRLQIDIIASALPAGAATAANQLPNNHDVVVTALPGGLATEATLNDVYSEVSDLNDLRKALADEAADELRVVFPVTPDVNAGVRRGALQRYSYLDVPGDTALHNAIDVAGAYAVDFLAFASDNKEASIHFVIDGNSFFCYNKAAVGMNAYTSHKLLHQAGGIFNFVATGLYDEANNDYLIRLASPIITSTNLKVQYKAKTAADAIGLLIGYRALT